MIRKLDDYLTPIFNLDPDYQRPLRIAVALAYTALLTLVLVQSSQQPIIGPAAPRQDNPIWEALLTTGHLVGFGLLVFLVWSALTTATTSTRSLIMAVIFACLLGLVTELLQALVPDRSSSLFDLACDWGVTFTVAYLIHRRTRRAV